MGKTWEAMRIAGPATFMYAAHHLQLDASKKCWLVRGEGLSVPT